MTDYQKRYLKHQQHGKKKELIALMKERHSNRRFSDEPITQETIDELIECLKETPSSCDRHGCRIKIITERDDKALLNGLLVGGVGFAYRVPVMFLIFADHRAYKGGDNGDEVTYNAPLDAGIMVQQLSLMATAMGLHCCFINPQVRKENREFFMERFKPKGWEDTTYMGAFCFGHKHPEEIEKIRNYDDLEMVVE